MKYLFVLLGTFLISGCLSLDPTTAAMRQAFR